MVLKGSGVSPGIALGNCYIYKAFTCDVDETYTEKGTEQQHLRRFKKALAIAGQELDNIIASFEKKDMDKSEIFAAHKEILFDEEVLEMAQQAITQENKMPDYAVMEIFAEFIELIEKTKDPLFAARGADFRDVRNRLVRVLHGEKEKNLADLPDAVIVVAHDLLPSDTATLDRKKVLGIITEVGSNTSHSAIIANSYRIPAVLGVPSCTEILQDGMLVGLDALLGDVYLNIEEAAQKQLLEKKKNWCLKRQQEEAFLGKEPQMADGTRLQVGLNIGSDKMEEELAYADYIGLFRTEFLYMESDHLPTEEEQYSAYKSVVLQAKGKPVTLRTLDIGGDKTLSYMQLPKEENPFLGKRALRLCFAQPELLVTQLRAALRASVHGPLGVMFPMVGSLEDIRKGKEYFEVAQKQLEEENIPYSKEVKVGIMVEIPSIAMVADLAAEEVDFASVGTNDLCQYLCAADRMNPDLGVYYQTFSPAMVRILGQIADAFAKQGKEVSVCGEMAGYPHGAVLLAGLGIEKVSMSGSKIAGVKAAFSKISMQEARVLAQKAKTMKTQQEVLQLYQPFIPQV